MSKKKIVLVKDLAKRYLDSVATNEFYFQVFKPEPTRDLLVLLRSFRDGHSKISDLSAVKDLGLLESYDYILLWSRDKNSIQALHDWLVSQGYETSGLWL